MNLDITSKDHYIVFHIKIKNTTKEIIFNEYKHNIREIW